MQPRLHFTGHALLPPTPFNSVQPYRKQRCHALVLLGYDFALPVLVVALGCFFSVSTLVLLFQVRRGELQACAVPSFHRLALLSGVGGCPRLLLIGGR